MTMILPEVQAVEEFVKIAEEFVKIADALELISSCLDSIQQDMPTPTPVQRAERLRQDRWHATYNAALPEAMRYWAERDEEDDSVPPLWATAMADRAHGPLEVRTKSEHGQRTDETDKTKT